MRAIQFSGGLDSLALMFFLRSMWEESIVMWVNSGAAYPDVIDYMARVRDLVPHFVEVRGNQPAAIEVNGFPVDVVPIKYTSVGEAMFGPQPVKYQSFVDCCYIGLWVPAFQAILDRKIQHIYRGQRREDRIKSPIRDGHVDHFGITYHFPLQDWTREDVWNYVTKTCPEWIPPYYRQGEVSSRDCWNCTAYRRDNVARVEHLPTAQRKVVESRLDNWKQHVMEELHGATS